ncbi:MAG: PKD domain-containing protein [Chitinophagales bacterium]|nr:PKD domain-containing protein [Chitinophagales bacterium]MDW8419072.1 T9SS type A sorting domain-containing protein [Chitinophagales bacterium]
MKQLFSFLLLFTAAFGYAQNTTDVLSQSKFIECTRYGKRTIAPESKIYRPTQPATFGSRAQNVNFILDYGYVDEMYAANVTSGDYYDDIIFQVSRRMPIDSSFVLRWAFQWYPRIIDPVNVPNWPFIEYPPANIQMTIDTIFVTLGHIRNSNKTDTVMVSVWDFDALNTISFGDSGATGTLYGRAFLFTDSSLTGPGSQPGSVLVGTFPIVPTTPIVIPQGKRFLVQVDFFGPNNDEFYLLAGRRNDCGNPTCGSSLPYVKDDFNVQVDDFNSLGSIRYGAGTPQAGSYPTVFFYNDCNGDGDGPDSLDCEFYPMSNLYIFPNIKAVIPNFYVAISTDKTFGCPGSTITLNASSAGSSATPYSYSWSTSSGTLSSTSDPEVTLTLGNQNAVVTVTVTDASNQTVTSSITINSRAVNVTITNPNPTIINCGGNTTITTTISGYTSGTETYAWSTGLTGTNPPSNPDVTKVTVDVPGTYNVTVTNSAGCTATASVNVQYPGGLTNNVNFTVPGGQKCKGQPVTFTNTSQRTNGWNYTWFFGDGNMGYTKDGTNIYQNPGSYNVKLEQDSAGCKFVSPTKTVTISNCTGIDDVSFANSISLVPNPTNGQITISISDNDGPVNIKVYNVIGSELKSFTADVAGSTFSRSYDLSDLPNGTYLVKIQSGAKSAVKRLTINK